MTGLLLASILLALFATGCFLWGLFFWQGARWTGIAGVSLTKAIVLGLAISVVTAAIGWIIQRIASDAGVGGIGITVLILAAGMVVSLVVLKVFVRGHLGRIALTWLLSTLATGTSLLLVLVSAIPFTFKGFVVPTNAMAPTLLGKHWTGVCPRCGAPAYSSAPDLRSDSFGDKPPFPLPMICSRELTGCHVDNATADPASPDRFVVCKVLRPQRWDVVAFQYPADPTKTYVKRLVGLPGETVVIEDGAVWISGQKMVAPGGQHYLSELTLPSGGSYPLWGTKQRPARLGPDEYFMLGDFSENSADSRVWREGAPGHPSYAVPGSYIVGVATHIYWPYKRWSVLR